MSRKIYICPSILSADFAKLGDEITAIEKSGADMVHVDVMDGHFVPNLTIGPVVIKSIRKTTKLPFDVHLMIETPEKYIDAYAKSGADIITFHYEAVSDMKAIINQIKATGKKAGISIKPNTSEQVLKDILPELDLILVMSVEPGFGGQKFMPNSLEKLRNLRAMIDKTGKDILLEVDGGINAETISSVLEAGADTIGAGSAVFDGNPNNYAENIKKLRN
jgi:ribulose-phosphate 3-epimerase